MLQRCGGDCEIHTHWRGHYTCIQSADRRGAEGRRTGQRTPLWLVRASRELTRRDEHLASCTHCAANSRASYRCARSAAIIILDLPDWLTFSKTSETSSRYATKGGERDGGKGNNNETRAKERQKCRTPSQNWVGSMNNSSAGPRPAAGEEEEVEASEERAKDHAHQGF